MYISEAFVHILAWVLKPTFNRCFNDMRLCDLITIKICFPAIAHSKILSFTAVVTQQRVNDIPFSRCSLGRLPNLSYIHIYNFLLPPLLSRPLELLHFHNLSYLSDTVGGKKNFSANDFRNRRNYRTRDRQERTYVRDAAQGKGILAWAETKEGKGRDKDWIILSLFVCRTWKIKKNSSTVNASVSHATRIGRSLVLPIEFRDIQYKN